MDSIKQAILLFVHSKLAINSDHRFAFAALGKTASWLQREFSSEVDSAIAALRGLSVDGSCGNADLTQLFRVAAHEAKKSRAQNRIFRVLYLRVVVENGLEYFFSQLVLYDLNLLQIFCSSSASMACQPETLHFGRGLSP
ncbi:unnamed protein product, partial [Vitis vinifera]|uniref:Uncharacterized protein n=1 Tax=Vitis vinifera TaxID=29760 RepID=D7STL8_VITVI